MIELLLISGAVIALWMWAACAVGGRSDTRRKGWTEHDRIVKEVDRSYQANKEHSANDNP